jgi:FAD/FMN-containing dehydrogenase
VTGSNVGEGIVIDLTRLPRVLAISPEKRTARTSANTRWGELTEAAARHGLRLPPDPSSGAFATLGGMVSTNASGAHSVRYGSMRQWVLGLTIVTAGGRTVVVRRGETSDLPFPRHQLRERQDLIRSRYPRTTKNSAGYALDAWLASGDDLDLLVGSEGTLGIITEIEWRLSPVPLHRTGLRIQLADLDRLTPAVEAVLKHHPSALEFLDRTFLDLVERGGIDGAPAAGDGRPGGPNLAPESILLVEFEGDEARALRETTAAAVRSLEGIASGVEIALSLEEEARVWRLRHAASPIIADLPPGRRSLQVIEDACVPVSRMGEYISAVRSLARRLEVPVVIFGHAGDGNIHVNLLPETGRKGWEKAVGILYEAITDEVIRLGGTTSGEHGDGRIRSSVLERLYGPEIVGLFHCIKAALDPDGILNPGVKVLKHPADPLSDLKVGSGATAIPEPVAEALRDIERKGDYLRDRLNHPSLSSE